MPSFDITPGEARLLFEIVNQELSNLNIEIGKTDDFEFRSSLKKRRDQVEHLLLALERNESVKIKRPEEIRP